MFKPEAFRGIFPPILTPLQDDDQVDQLSLRRLVDFQLERGVHGIWVCGSTGEFPCFDEKTRESIVSITVDQVGGRVPVIASIGDASTRLAIRHGLAAKSAGADAVAATPPYYFPNTQEDLQDHYRAIRESVDLPLLVYNFPQMVKIRVEPATMLALVADGTIVGMKDSSGDAVYNREVMIGVQRLNRVFRSFIGNVHLIDVAVLFGGCGSVPAIGNVVPQLTVAAYEAAARGDWTEATHWQAKLFDAFCLTRAVRASVQSIMKSALKTMGIISTARVSLPLKTVSAEDEERIKDYLVKYDLISRS